MSWDGPIDRILAREGGFSDRKDDPGGTTKFGITAGTLSKWRKVPVTTDDVRALELPEARSIYVQVFIKDTNLELLHSTRLREVVLDWAVNSGPGRAIRALQRRLGVHVDGELGPKTAAAANAATDGLLANDLLWDRVDFIADWMRNDRSDRDMDGVPDSMENAAGIMKRIAAIGRARG